MAANLINTEPGTSVQADLLKGALAGAVGAVAMDRTGWFMMKRESISALTKEAQLRPGGMDPAHILANRMANAVGVRLQPEQPHPAGIAMFFALAMLPGAFYGVLLNRVERIGLARGLLYGFAAFVLMDEVMSPALGLAEKPNRYPWQAHMRGLVSHLALGVATYAAFQVFNKLSGR
jgi:hypothetical protein